MSNCRLHWSSCLSLILLFGGSTYAAEDASPTRLSANLAGEVNGPLLADFPLLFNLTVINTGKTPISYLCGGPGEYPKARPFVVSVTDHLGRLQQLRLHNGQYEVGSAERLAITHKVTFPAACDPLPPGTYTLQIAAKADYEKIDGKSVEVRPAMTAAPITVTIVEDRKALVAAESDLRAQESKDPFARHVAEVYSIDPIVATWLEDLLNDDPNVGLDACGELQRVIRLPPNGDDFLKKAAIKFCHPGTGKAERDILREISLISRGIGTDNAIDAILIIATSAVDEDDVRSLAVSDLAGIPGPRSERALLDLASDDNSPVYWQALVGLADRHNSAALRPLLQAATDTNSDHRSFALVALTAFRDLPEVRAALNAGLTDKNASVRAAARKALEWMEFGSGEMIQW
jgi:hypothetical protein